jgi:hypothetical protein
MASAVQVEHKKELQTLVKQLSEATDAYDPSAGPEDSQSRTRRIEIVNKAKQLMLKLTEPVEASQQHGVNVSRWILPCEVVVQWVLCGAHCSTTLTARCSLF